MMQVKIIYKKNMCVDRKIACIKFYRYVTGYGLKESKEAVEEHQHDDPSIHLVETSMPFSAIQEMIKQDNLDGDVEVKPHHHIQGSFHLVGDGFCEFQIEDEFSHKIDLKIKVEDMGKVIQFFSDIGIHTR